jgi:hypothetical protein
LRKKSPNFWTVSRISILAMGEIEIE